MGYDLYGPIGIVLGEVFYVFPHVLMIILIAMSMSDGRLYEAAQALGAGMVKTFFSVTLPGIRYGLVSAGFVGFTLVITDFGVPKVVGGNFNVLATDVYKQVVGRQDFAMGAVVWRSGLPSFDAQGVQKEDPHSMRFTVFVEPRMSWWEAWNVFMN